MVKNALSSIVECPTRLITFSDDMDGLRKVPENVPNKEMLREFLGKFLLLYQILLVNMKVLDITIMLN